MHNTDKLPAKRLFITNTFFQLLVVMQIRRYLLPDGLCDVIITNHSTQSEQVAQRLRKEQIFDHVFYVEDRNEHIPRDLAGRALYYLPVLLDRRRALEKQVKLTEQYDEIWFYNPIMLTQLICHKYRHAKLFLFEEGYGTYTMPLIQKSAVRKIFRFIFGDIEKRISALYLFHPELLQMKVDYPAIQIPVFDKNDLTMRDMINRAFDFDPSCLQIAEKYIFFEESFRLSGVPIDDISLIRTLQKAVSPQKLCIKQHPRSLSNPFTEMNARVLNEIKHVPWEVVLMNECIGEDKILVTISSGSVLAPALYFGQHHRIVLLYKCIEPLSPAVNEPFLRYIKQVQSKSDSICIADRIDDLPM